MTDSGQTPPTALEVGNLKIPAAPPLIRHFWAILSLLLLFCALWKIPTLALSHQEPDERIYWQLANSLLTTGHYTLQGSDILPYLSPNIYDRPVFCHPPLFAALLTPFAYLKTQSFAVVVSWLGHFLCILSVALIGRRMVPNPFPATGRNQLFFWLPVIGMTLDPFLIFLGRKLWIDGLLAGLCATSMAFFFCARYSPRRTIYLIAGGALFGLAGLAKLPALALGPVILFLILTPENAKRRPVRDLCLGFLPALVVMLPWFILFYRTYGVLIPGWTKPDDWTMQRYPMVRAAVERTPLYYLGRLAALQPVILPCLVLYMVRPALCKKAASALPLFWFLIIFLAISYVGLAGQGFQMRFLAPLFPAIYLMVYVLMSGWGDSGRETWAMLILLVFIFAGINGSLYLVLPQFDEIRLPFALWNWSAL